MNPDNPSFRDCIRSNRDSNRNSSMSKMLNHFRMKTIKKGRITLLSGGKGLKNPRNFYLQLDRDVDRGEGIKISRLGMEALNLKLTYNELSKLHMAIEQVLYSKKNNHCARRLQRKKFLTKFRKLGKAMVVAGVPYA